MLLSAMADESVLSDERLKRMVCLPADGASSISCMRSRAKSVEQLYLMVRLRRSYL
jgi:hypothetical protein